MKPFLLYSKPYYNGTEGADPRSGETYKLCQRVKENPYKIPVEALADYVRALPRKCILIPVPGHNGRAGYTRDLCNRLQKAAGISKDVRIIDALWCNPRPSLCEMKRAGKDTSDVEVKFKINTNETSRGDLGMLSRTFDIVLVDNILDTGKTMTAAAEAVHADGAEPLCITLGYTGNDEGIYNPCRMLEELRAGLDKSYNLNDIDYRDVFPDKEVEKCLEAKSLSPVVEEDLWSETTYTNAREIAKLAVEDSDFDEEDKQQFLDEEEFLLLVQEVEERNESSPEKECFLNTRTHGRLTINSNYDCWVPPYAAGCLYSKESLLWGLMAELCLNPKKVKEEVLRVWDVPVKGSWPDLKSRNGKEVVSYRAFVDVLFDCPNTGKWAFFGVFDMQALLDKGFNTDDMVIPKGTTCTMYNSWDGGGSCATATTLRDLPVRELIRRAAPHQDSVAVLVDEKGCGCGYASNEVYAGHLSDDEFLN